VVGVDGEKNNEAKAQVEEFCVDPAMFHILLALADRERMDIHMQEVEERTEGRWPGTGNVVRLDQANVG